MSNTAAKLRKLADFIEANGIGDDAILSASVEYAWSAGEQRVALIERAPVLPALIRRASVILRASVIGESRGQHRDIVVDGVRVAWIVASPARTLSDRDALLAELEDKP